LIITTAIVIVVINHLFQKLQKFSVKMMSDSTRL